MDKMLDKIDESLEAALFEKVGLPLIMLQSMSMSILEGNWAIRKYVVLDTKLKRCIFATFFTSTTIQDGSREKEAVCIMLYSNSKFKIWK